MATQHLPRVAANEGDITSPAQVSSEEVWHALERASFAVVSYLSPSGEPRSSGVVYDVVDHHVYFAVASDSWKAKEIAVNGSVAVTVPIRRGGLLSLLFPIPPATVSFHGSAKVHQAGSPEANAALERLASLLPPGRRETGAIIEVAPEAAFLTYGVGVSLNVMRDPTRARARVPVATAN